MLLNKTSDFKGVSVDSEQIDRQSFKLLENAKTQYIQHLKSLLPSCLLFDYESQFDQTPYPNKVLVKSRKKFNLDLSMSSKSTIKFQAHRKANKMPIGTYSSLKESEETVQDFILRIVQTVAREKCLEEGPHSFQPLLKQLGIDLKQINKIQEEHQIVNFMLQCIDRNIEDHKKRLTSNIKGSKSSASNKENSIINKTAQSTPCLLNNYQLFVKEQQKKNIDNFSWLQINTKYPMIEKKLKAKLIQSINEDKNEKNIRELILKKSNNLKGSKFYNPHLDDEKVEIQNESLFLQQFQKAKIEYTWTQNDEQLFKENVQQLKKKCVHKSQFIKLCGRFKFITHSEFETLACEEISRKLNRNNKIYLSRQFLLDKYFSTTEVLTEKQMRFILKTSPMLSKCVDRNFIKSAIKNIKYDNISELQLKIAEDIIGKLEKLRESVRVSRKIYTNYTNNNIKDKVARFQSNKQFAIAREIARQQLQQHKVTMKRSQNYQKKSSSNTPSGLVRSKGTHGLSKVQNVNTWSPLNKYHVSTGLFVKDCNEQCTDDLFNPYQKLYIEGNGSIQAQTSNKTSCQNKINMLKFYTGGPDENILSNFGQTKEDVKNVCNFLKASFFEKKILVALQSINICVESPRQTTTREQTRPNLTIVDIRTRKTMSMLPANGGNQDIESIAKRKMMENRQRAKQTIYVNKLLFLSAQNSLQSLKALNPYFSPQQINTKDKKGNTALYYCAKNNNQDFVDYVLKFGGNPNQTCSGKNTPLHIAFKSNNVNLILKMLTSHMNSPDLNILNGQGKTALAYASRKVLKKLGLEAGVTFVDPKEGNPYSFDNNELLEREQHDKIKEETIEINDTIQIKYKRKNKRTLTSIQNMDDA